MKNFKVKVLCIIGLFVLCVDAIDLNAQNTKIEVFANVERFIGGTSQLDRTKYFTIHSTGNDADSLAFYKDYNVFPSGRQFSGPGATAFTAADSTGVYPSVNLLNNHMEWSADDGWYLDVSNQKAISALSWKKAVWQVPFTVTSGDSLLIETDFYIDGTLTGLNGTINTFGMQDTPSGQVNFNQCYLSSQSWGGGKIAMRNNTNGLLNQGAFLNQSDIVGDTLKIEMKIKLGNNAASSIVSTRLVNISDGGASNWGSYTGIDQNLYNAATSTGIYFFMNSQDLGTMGISALEFTDITVNGIQCDLSTSLSAGTGVLPVSNKVITDHPYTVYSEGLNTDAFGDWAVEYFKNHTDSLARPLWYEPFNEPFVHALDFYDEQDWDPVAEARVKGEMSEVIKSVGEKIHAEPTLANMKVVGFASAWPSFELQDFSNWENNMKMFLDTAGDHIDAISYHLYDGVNQAGQDNLRAGSNNEAIMDLIETYSYSKWGTIKPHMITEFGGIGEAVYSDLNVSQSVRSQNSMIFGLMEREDRMEMTIPFTTGKSEWHITSENNYLPYKAVLWKPTNMGAPVGQIQGWEYTNRIYFYEMWKNVEGDRVLVKSDNPDVQIQAFVSQNKLFVAMNNLDDSTQTVDLSLLGQLPTLSEVRTKSLIVHKDQNPTFTDQTDTVLPATISLSFGETVILEYTFTGNISLDNTINSNNYYSTKHVEAIVANTAMIYQFNGVTKGAGYATLRMGIGRKHTNSKSPVVLVNGTTVSVPTNWKGYDQANRTDFFGTIEIPVPLSLIDTNNTISIDFPDSGGHVSSLILNVEKFSTTDSIALNNVPTVMKLDTILDFTVDYSANLQRDLKVIVEDPFGVSLGSQTISVNLGATPSAANDYKIIASIRPVGGDWTTNIEKVIDYVDLTAASGSKFSIESGKTKTEDAESDSEDFIVIIYPNPSSGEMVNVRFKDY